MKELKKNITLRQMELHEINNEILKKFIRYHEVTLVCYMENGEIKNTEHPFTEDWDDDEKNEIIEEMREAITSGGALIGAFDNERLIGFGSVDGLPLGENKEYRQMHLLYISCDYQGYGLGKKLFLMCANYAKEIGVEKLYVSSHCSLETVSFYQAMGCVKAKWIYDKQVELEPHDIQLEYVL